MPRSPADFRERVRSHGALGVSAIYAPVMRSDRSPGDRLRSGVKPSDFELWLHRSPDPAAGSLLSSRLWRPVCRRDNDEQLEPDGRHHGSFISLHRVRIAVAVTLIRGFARQRSPTIGNFWVDLTRGTLYVLIPICVLAALFLVSQGVPQTLAQPSRNLRLLPLRTF
jgi:hypothetical protein